MEDEGPKALIFSLPPPPVLSKTMELIFKVVDQNVNSENRGIKVNHLESIHDR